jgi:hypothetical protein
MKFSTSLVLTRNLTILIWIFLQTIIGVQLKAVFKVGVFYDWNFPDGIERISKLKGNSTRFQPGGGSANFNETRFSIDFIPYPLQGLTLAQITDLFCERIIKEEVSAIALHTKDTKLTRYLAHLASHLWIPAIGTTTKDPVLSDKVFVLRSVFQS